MASVQRFTMQWIWIGEIVWKCSKIVMQIKRSFIRHFGTEPEGIDLNVLTPSFKMR